MGDTDAVLTYGTGTSNPFRGIVNSILVSPFIGAAYKYGWVLMEPRKAFMMQEVLPLELTQLTNTTDWPYHQADVLEYKAREVYGVGVLNDRFAYFSSSVTAPTVT